MKKLILSLAIVGFVSFGVLNLQSVVAASSNVEMVNFDKDPKKDGDKKSTEVKDAKAGAKSADAGCAKDCSSSCSDKSASASASCCDKSKESCSKSCPDKK
jgi:hypothetical protein